MRLALIWFSLVIVTQAADRPELTARDVVRSADRSSGGVAPGEIVVLYPSDAGPEILAGSERNDENKMETRIGDTRVLFDGVAAPMVYAIKGQVSAVVPYEVAGKKTTQVVVEYRGVASTPVTVEVIDVAPALFTLDSSGKGQAAMLNDSGCCNSASNPAARGSVVALYATGEGQTNPRGVTGLFSAHEREADYPVPRQKVRVTVGGELAEVVWAAEAPHTVSGLLQVNFRIPVKAPVGDAVPLVLMVGDSRSPEGLTMAVRSAVHQILLMDEAPGTRLWLRKVLVDAGYEVFTARNDLEARVKTHENPIDLVISSLATREETIAAMRAERKHLKTAVIVGAADIESLRAADLLGAQAVLTKNMSAMDVQRRVRELVRAHPVPYVATEAILRP
jgi:uncharacterized protein (TIGR03437 family)